MKKFSLARRSKLTAHVTERDVRTRRERLDELVARSGRHIESERRIDAIIREEQEALESNGQNGHLMLLMQLKHEARIDALDLLAPGIFSYALLALKEVEGVNLPSLEEEDLEYLALGTANKIIDYWLRREKQPADYTVSLKFVRGFARGFIREGWIFGRLDRISQHERKRVSMDDLYITEM